MDIQQLYSAFNQCGQNICTDTRSIERNSLFFALSGDNFDGNKFINTAIENGCKIAISDNPENKKKENVIYVENTLIALQELANYHRSQFKIPVLAITGTNGKTTTKELLACALSTKFNLLYTLGNLNNHIGVPLTLLKLRKEHDFAIIEMGANKPGDILELCEIAEPDYGLITNIGTAHIEGFGSAQGVIKTKTELYDYIINKQGILFVNKSEEYLIALTRSYSHVIEYGKGTGFDFDVIEKSYQLEMIINKDLLKTNLFGKYNGSNVLTALAVGKEFQVPYEDSKKSIENYKPRNNRSQLKITERGNHLILDAYNANPSSLNLAIDELLSMSGGKLFIIGSMKELGNISKKEHELILAKLSGENSVFVGDEFMSIKSEKVNVFESVNDLIKDGFLKNISKTQILIKGSRSIELEKVVDFL